MAMRETVASFAARTLAAHGVRHVFGVAGDYSFPVCDAILAEPSLQWVGTATESTAGAMADGAARVGGISALCTTFGVGELGASHAVAGAFAERVPVVHLVGMPPDRLRRSGAIVHHTLGDGRFDHWMEVARPCACASGVLTAANATRLLPRLLQLAKWHSRPVYIGIPADTAEEAVREPGEEVALAAPRSDPQALEAAVEEILSRIEESTSACALVSALAVRLGLRTEVLRLLERSGMPFAAMWMDKSALDESHPLYCGMYSGRLTNRALCEFIEGCDLVLNLGALESDLNLGAYTARLDRLRCVTVGMSEVRVGAAAFHDVQMADVVAALAARVSRREFASAPAAPQPPVARGAADQPISAEALFPRIAAMLQPGDMVFVDTGTISMGVMPLRMPRGVECHTQALWGSIGWAFPAGVGGAIADPSRRCVILTGEGAFQYGAAEIGTASRYGARPLVVVVNNDGYLTERVLCADPAAPYNDIPRWDYAQIPRVLGGVDWWIRRAETCGELDDALRALARSSGPALVEVVTPRMAMPELAHSLQERLDSLYQA